MDRYVTEISSSDMLKDPNGEYVLYSDYITLQDKIKGLAEKYKRTGMAHHDYCADELLSLLESVQDLPDTKSAP